MSTGENTHTQQAGTGIEVGRINEIESEAASTGEKQLVK